MSAKDLTKGWYRRVYAGYLTGQRINRCSLEAEAMFFRLNMVADDYGNFQADGLVLRSLAFPRRDVTLDQVKAWLGELVDAALVTLYSAEGDQYGHLCDFEELQTTSNGKLVRRFPPPPQSGQMNPGEPKPNQMNPDETGGGQAEPDHNENETENENKNENKIETEIVSSARAGASDSDSLARVRAWPRFQMGIHPIWSQDERQARGDRTDTKALFEDIWPEDSPLPVPVLLDRVRRVIDLAKSHNVRSAKRPMAYLKSMVAKLQAKPDWGGG